MSNIFNGKIRYFIALPNELGETSIFQGFSESLIHKARVLRVLEGLPGDIYEPTETRDITLPRRIGGEGGVQWFPIAISALKAIPYSYNFPFSVIFADQDIDLPVFRRWCDQEICPPLLVSPVEQHISIQELNNSTLQKHFLKNLESITHLISKEEYDEHKQALNSWKDFPLNLPPFDIRGNHYSLLPNYIALRASGYEIDDRRPMVVKSIGNLEYIEAIKETVNAVYKIRDDIGYRLMYKLYPPMPDLFLFAPSMYKNWIDRTPKFVDGDGLDAKKIHRSIMAHIKQKGYQFSLNESDASLLFGDNGPSQELEMISSIRVQEIAINSTIIGLKAASTISATIRLPNSINRTAGEVRQFSMQARSVNRNEVKRVKAFEKLQTKLLEAIPDAYIELIEKSQYGIKIVSDIPIEWLPLNGLPLCIKKNVSRIPTTPGNLQVSQLLPKETIELQYTDFSEILICSAIHPKDKIKKCFEVAFDTFSPLWRDKISLNIVETTNREELIQAINTFDGPLMIFDGHGSHEEGNNSGKLRLYDDQINVWELRDDINNPPPIVILSACDTYAADRSHETTASGFLNMGTRTVLGTFLPIDAMDAATFIARLIYRISEYIPTIVTSENGRAIRWDNVVCGMIRMQLLSDFIRRLYEFKILNEEDSKAVNIYGNVELNRGNEEAFDKIKEKINKDFGISTSIIEEHFRTALANSTAIAYTSLGNPESILIDCIEARANRLPPDDLCHSH